MKTDWAVERPRDAITKDGVDFECIRVDLSSPINLIWSNRVALRATHGPQAPPGLVRICVSNMRGRRL